MKPEMQHIEKILGDKDAMYPGTHTFSLENESNYHQRIGPFEVTRESDSAMSSRPSERNIERAEVQQIGK